MYIYKKRIKLVEIFNRSNWFPIGPRGQIPISTRGLLCKPDPEFDFQVWPQILEKDRSAGGG